VQPEKLHKIADFLRVAHGLPVISQAVTHAAEDLEYYRGAVARLQREIAALRARVEHHHA
jgi:hypothetical protein